MPGYLKDGQASLYLLASFKRKTVSTLVCLWICLVCADSDCVQGAQVLCLFMMSALIYCAADCLVTRMHKISSFVI